MKRSSSKHSICLICYQVQQSTLIAFHNVKIVRVVYVVTKLSQRSLQYAKQIIYFLQLNSVHPLAVENKLFC
jgi:hypothetical protein